MPKPVKSKKFKGRVLVIVAVGVAVLVAVAVCLFLDFDNNQSDNRPARRSGPPAKHSLTASGVEVPQQFVEKAESLGYYCPSWAAKPGEVASGVCLKLDR